MRIHSDTLTPYEIYNAASVAGVRVEFTRHGSRARKGAYNVYLSGSSPYRHNGHKRNDHAASWDEWGSFLGTLFAHDPHAIAGPYLSGEHYAWVTGGQYDHGNLPERHKVHHWDWDGSTYGSGAYMIHRCACGAIKRFGDYDRIKDWERVSA